MASELHIDTLDDDTLRRLKEDAERRGVSAAERAAEIIERQYPSLRPGDPPHMAGILQLFGTWTEAEAREFEESIRDFERIDEPSEMSSD